MFGLIWSLSASIHAFLRRAVPTNILIAAIMTRRGLKWGVPAMALAPVYLFGALVCFGLVDQGAPGWVHLLVLLFVWNALKFMVLGPVSLLRLASARAVEAGERRAAAVLVASDGVALRRVEGEHVDA